MKKISVTKGMSVSFKHTPWLDGRWQIRRENFYKL